MRSSKDKTRTIEKVWLHLISGVIILVEFVHMTVFKPRNIYERLLNRIYYIQDLNVYFVY